jgi:transposase
MIGIDEWSRRKGSDFGSIIVDLERRQVIDVLPDRAASSVAAWMRNHPDIEYVVRDRDGGQVEGQINRLKVLKRGMYGRVRVEILRASYFHCHTSGRTQIPTEPI